MTRQYSKSRVAAQYAIQSMLSVGWTNLDDHTPNIYLGRSNTGEVTVTNGLTEAINLVPTSSISIDFNGLLANGEIAKIELTFPKDWTMTTASMAGRTVLEITPLVHRLNPGDNLALELTNIACADPLAATWVTVTISGVTPPPSLAAGGYNMLVQGANPPLSINQALNLNADFLGGSNVLITGGQTIQNTLILYLANPNDASLVPSSSGAMFQVNFLYDPVSQNALTTFGDAATFPVNQSGGAGWGIEQG